jgi:hypothetical protein
MKNEEGAVELGALAILLFLTSLMSGIVLLAQVTMTYGRRSGDNFAEKEAVNRLLQKMVSEIRELRGYDYDHKDNTLLRSLESTYADKGLTINDVSSGYHLDFLTDEDLEDTILAEYLFLSKNASDFKDWRNNNGLSVSSEPWKPFLRQEVWEACSSYGWVHKRLVQSYAFRSISNTFDITDLDKLFPLVNELPLMNVNMVSPDILAPLIMRPSFKIENPAEKFTALKQKLLSGPVLKSDISAVLNIPVSNQLFSYLGVKTTFWKLRFFMRPGLRIEAILAAVPEEHGDGETIAEYRLIERSFIYEK